MSAIDKNHPSAVVQLQGGTMDALQPLTVAEALKLCLEWQQQNSGSGVSITLPTRAWNAKHDWKSWPEFDTEKGVYIYSDPSQSTTPPTECQEIVWYIGKAEGKGKRPLAARIYAHFKKMFDEKNKPPSSEHDWHQSPNREVNEYSVAVRCVKNPAAWASDLETFLLEASSTRFAGRPPLNRR
jgi:hypothetical protein